MICVIQFPGYFAPKYKHRIPHSLQTGASATMLNLKLSSTSS
jgi:hypothetical protein